MKDGRFAEARAALNVAIEELSATKAKWVRVAPRRSRHCTKRSRAWRPIWKVRNRPRWSNRGT